MSQEFKQLVLKAVKTEKEILKGEEICRSIVAVQNIKKNKKLNLVKKLDLLERYIKGIKEKSKTDIDMIEHSNRWESESIEKCLKYLSSIGVNLPKDRKKYMDGLTGSEEKKRVKEIVEKSKQTKSTPNLLKKPSLIKVSSRSSSVLPKEFIDKLFADW